MSRKKREYLKTKINEHETSIKNTNIRDFHRDIKDFKKATSLDYHPFLFNLALEYAIKKVQANQEGFKLNVTHQVLDYADDVNTRILDGSIHSIKKNTEAFFVSSKEIGLEVNAGKTKYPCLEPSMLERHNIKAGNIL